MKKSLEGKMPHNASVQDYCPICILFNYATLPIY